MKRVYRVEKQGLKVNNKTRVCREFSWQQALGLGLNHHEFTLNKTLLGLILLVTKRDSGLWVELGNSESNNSTHS